jgi:hypothetical protein
LSSQHKALSSVPGTTKQQQSKKQKKPPNQTINTKESKTEEGKNVIFCKNKKLNMVGARPFLPKEIWSQHEDPFPFLPCKRGSTDHLAPSFQLRRCPNFKVHVDPIFLSPGD